MTYNPTNAFSRVQLVLDPRCSGGLLLESTLLELKFQKHGCLRLKKHNNRRSAKKRTAERTTHQNSEDRDAPITAVENQLNSQPHRLMKIDYNCSSMQSKRRDSHSK